MIKELLRRFWEKIVTGALIAGALILTILYFLSQSEKKEDKKLKDRIEEIRTERTRLQGREEEVSERRDEIIDEIEEGRNDISDAEKELESNDAEAARDRLKDLVDRYGDDHD